MKFYREKTFHISPKQTIITKHEKECALPNNFQTIMNTRFDENIENSVGTKQCGFQALNLYNDLK